MRKKNRATKRIKKERRKKLEKQEELDEGNRRE
jgi:hypothetical protein